MFFVSINDHHFVKSYKMFKMHADHFNLFYWDFAKSWIKEQETKTYDNNDKPTFLSTCIQIYLL